MDKEQQILIRTGFSRKKAEEVLPVFKNALKKYEEEKEQELIKKKIKEQTLETKDITEPRKI